MQGVDSRSPSVYTIGQEQIFELDDHINVSKRDIAVPLISIVVPQADRSFLMPNPN